MNACLANAVTEGDVIAVRTEDGRTYRGVVVSADSINATTQLLLKQSPKRTGARPDTIYLDIQDIDSVEKQDAHTTLGVVAGVLVCVGVAVFVLFGTIGYGNPR